MRYKHDRGLCTLWIEGVITWLVIGLGNNRFCCCEFNSTLRKIHKNVESKPMTSKIED